MEIQRQTKGSACARFATVDMSRRAWFFIPHRYIRIARALDMKIKFAKAQFVGVQHA